MNIIFKIILFVCCINTANAELNGHQNVELANIIVSKDSSSRTVFYVKDESQYSKTFLSEFKEKHSAYDTVILTADTIVINNDRDNFILIPTDLPLNDSAVYEGNMDGIKFLLIIKRINVSTIEYSYVSTFANLNLVELHGRADLEPVFYFGAEATFEDENENIYGMNEYIEFSEDGCKTLIYIGIGSIEKSFLKRYCNSETDSSKTPLLMKKGDDR